MSRLYISGVAQVNLSVWTAESGWKTVLRRIAGEADRTDQYDDRRCKLPGVGQKVRHSG